MSDLQELLDDIKRAANKDKAILLKGYFKEPKAGYPTDDTFHGITVPVSRSIAKKYTDVDLEIIEKLLDSLFHEERLIALLILVHNFQKGTLKEKKEIFDFYLSHTRGVNNWDLVDASAHKIVGTWLVEQGKDWTLLKKLAQSKNIWERRIAIISTFAFIGKKDATASLEIAELLLQDKEDLIHKAVGWTLREVGKRVNQEKEEVFLKKYYRTMPRTTLRYAIERFPEKLRKAYLLGEI